MTVELRPAGDDDAPAVVDLFNAVSQALYGEDDTSEEEVRALFGLPSIDVARDIRLAFADGELVGYADVYDQNGWHTRYWCDPRVDPGKAGPGAAAALVAWCEERARSDAAEGAFLRGYVPERAGLVRSAFEQRGYRIIRSSFRMGIALDGEPVAPEWPDGVAVRSMRPGEERAVYEAHEECFRDHWEHVEEPYEEWRAWMVERPTFDPALWLLAVEGDEIAGYALCGPKAGDPGAGWVELLGVRRPWRRLGLGRALLLHAFGELRRRGFERAGLGVDAENLTGAVRLYESAGMHVVRRFDCFHRDL